MNLYTIFPFMSCLTVTYLQNNTSIMDSYVKIDTWQLVFSY
jgi:hypothetical protein